MLDRLSKPIFRDEVHTTIFATKPLKALEVDGLPTAFFQQHWDMVGDSICDMVMKAFQGMELEKGLNKTLLILIPKVHWPASVKEFRAISLLNVSFKLITKIMADILKDIMPYLISNTQASFVEGCNISDNIILAEEVIYSMSKKKGKTGLMTIKVDLENAYDRISWDVIEDTLFDMGWVSEAPDHSCHAMH